MKKINYLLAGIFLLLAVNINGQTETHKLTLEDAIQIALKNNPADKIAFSKIKEAEGKITQANSLLAPKIDLLGKYFYSNNLPYFFPQQMKKVPVMSPNGQVPGEFVPLRPLSPFPSNSRDVFMFDLNMVYPLYTWGKITSANENAETLKNLFETNKEETDAQIVYNVKKAFYNILFLNQVIDLHKKVIAQLEEHLELAQKAYEEGVRSQFEVISFDAKIKEFKTKLVDLEGKLEVAKTGLSNLLNLPPQDSIYCIGNLQMSEEEIAKINSLTLDKIYSQNNKVEMLKKKEKLMDNMIKINSADNKPVIFAFANYHVYHGRDFPPYDDAWRNGWAAGLGVKMKIFDGNMTSGKIQEAKAQMEGVKYTEEGLKLKLRFQYKSSIEKIRSLQEQLKAVQNTLKVAEKGYEIAKISYENGVITNVQLDDAQLNVLRNKTRLYQINKELLLEKANLDLILGKLN